MQLLEAARAAAERRSAALRLTAPPQSWATPVDPRALVEFVPLNLHGAGGKLQVVKCGLMVSQQSGDCCWASKCTVGKDEIM